MSMRMFGVLIVAVAVLMQCGCGKSERKFTSISGEGSIARINRDYDKRHETERKKREESEKKARDHTRAVRDDDASNFPDKRTEDAQFIEK